MRKPIIAGNWKMNLTPEEAEMLVKAILPLVSGAACDVVVCPPFVDLAAVKPLLAGSNVKLGAQNVHWAEQGAFTGEVSAAMLKSLGVEFVIVGHSERRQYFGDTDETVNARAKAALSHGITPIICIGESLAQREAGVTDAIVEAQLKGALSGMDAAAVKTAVIAYEPIWAIGTGKTATDQEANDTIAVIRKAVGQLYGEKVSDAIRIQYGGSMNAKNASGLMAQSEIDGGLIGGASLKAEDFAKVVNY